MATTLYMHYGPADYAVRNPYQINLTSGYESTNWSSYPNNNAYSLSTTADTAANTLSCSTLGTITAPGYRFAAQWLSRPLASSVTISSTITANIWASESSMSANASIRVLLWRVQPTGATTNFADGFLGTEVGTSLTEYSWTFTPTSTTFDAGDCILATVYTDDATGLTMGNGYSVNISVGGASGSSGDSFIQFTETLSFVSPYGAGNGEYRLSVNASDITGSWNKKLWTGETSTETGYYSSTSATVSPQITDGTYANSWYTPPVQAVDLQGLFSVAISMNVDNTLARTTAYVKVYKTNQDGTSPVQIGYARHNGYLSTTASSYVFYGHIWGSLTDGQRLKVEVRAGSDTNGQAASGYYFYAYVGGTGAYLYLPAALTLYNTGTTADAGNAAITASAETAQRSIDASATNAAISTTTDNPTASSEKIVDATTATVAAAANDPQRDITPTQTAATATATANNAQGSTTASATVATGTAVGVDAAGAVTASQVAITSTATANGAQGSIATEGVAATGSAAAYDATVGTATATFADAILADESATADNVQAGVTPTQTVATATALAQNAQTSVSPTQTVASATATAGNADGIVSPTQTVAAATTAAVDASGLVSPIAEGVTSAVASDNATVQIDQGGETFADAWTASVGTDSQSAPALEVPSETGAGTVTTSNATPSKNYVSYAGSYAYAYAFAYNATTNARQVDPITANVAANAGNVTSERLDVYASTAGVVALALDAMDQYAYAGTAKVEGQPIYTVADTGGATAITAEVLAEASPYWWIRIEHVSDRVRRAMWTFEDGVLGERITDFEEDNYANRYYEYGYIDYRSWDTPRDDVVYDNKHVMHGLQSAKYTGHTGIRNWNAAVQTWTTRYAEAYYTFDDSYDSSFKATIVGYFYVEDDFQPSYGSTTGYWGNDNVYGVRFLTLYNNNWVCAIGLTTDHQFVMDIGGNPAWWWPDVRFPKGEWVRVELYADGVAPYVWNFGVGVYLGDSLTPIIEEEFLADPNAWAIPDNPIWGFKAGTGGGTYAPQIPMWWDSIQVLLGEASLGHNQWSDPVPQTANVSAIIHNAGAADTIVDAYTAEVGVEAFFTEIRIPIGLPGTARAVNLSVATDRPSAELAAEPQTAQVSATAINSGVDPVPFTATAAVAAYDASPSTANFTTVFPSTIDVGVTVEQSARTTFWQATTATGAISSTAAGYTISPNAGAIISTATAVTVSGTTIATSLTASATGTVVSYQPEVITKLSSTVLAPSAFFVIYAPSPMVTAGAKVTAPAASFTFASVTPAVIVMSYADAIGAEVTASLAAPAPKYSGKVVSPASGTRFDPQIPKFKATKRRRRYLLTMPVQDEQVSKNHPFLRYDKNYGVSVLIEGGQVSQHVGPRQDRVRDADYAYLGGHENIVSETEATILTNAGYVVTEVDSEFDEVTG